MKAKIVLTSLLSMTLLQAVDTNATEMSPKQEGITYIKMLGTALKTELQAHMKKDPSGLDALAFCTGSAERMTDEINAKLPAYAKVRRTSLQTRNGKNAPDATDTEVMKAYETEIKAKTFFPTDIKVVEEGNTTRVYKALVTQAACLKCHGEHIALEIQNALKSSYPHDKATHFKAGSLRGVIVAEIQKH